MTHVIAVDVGGTSIKGALVDAAGNRSGETVVSTPVAGGPDVVLDAIRATVASLAGAGARVDAVGVVVPGDVDAEGGVARFSANIGWRDAPLRELLRRDLGLPTVLDHDVRAAGLAERVIGRARGLTDSLVAVIGTGIAGVVTAAGHTVEGARRVAGELGHMPVWPDGEACPCGQRGCLERYASAAAIARRHAARTGESLDAAGVLARVSTDAHAAAVWADAVEALAIAFASCTMLLDPSVILLSGGLSRAGDALRDPLRVALAERVVWRECPALEVSTLGSGAGLLGAAILAWRAVGTTDFAPWTSAARA